MNNANQSSIPSPMNNEQSRYTNDVVRDLPPKSPGTRRFMPKVPIQIKRGEVTIDFKCENLRGKYY
jgi:hypothetical protein